MALKENYKDDILDTSQNVKRKYQMENNGDGTVSFTDVTEYTQQGDSFGSGDINATNGKVNTLDSAVTTLNANLDGFKFYPTGTGIVGLIADDSAYTDEDGNYVIWGTATANQLVEDNPNTYKSVPSEEDLRGKVEEDTAVSFGGKTMNNELSPYAYYASTADMQYSDGINVKNAVAKVYNASSELFDILSDNVVRFAKDCTVTMYCNFMGNPKQLYLYKNNVSETINSSTSGTGGDGGTGSPKIIQRSFNKGDTLYVKCTSDSLQAQIVARVYILKADVIYN